MALVTLFIAGMIVLIGDSENDRTFFYVAIGIAAIGVACWVIMSRTVLTIHDEGVRRTTAFGVKELEWIEVQEYRYRTVSSNAGAAHVGGLLGLLIVAAVNRTSSGRRATTNFYLQLIGRDDTKIWVTSFYKDAYDAIGTIIDRIHRERRPQVESAIAATGAEFGPVRLSTRGVQWKSKDPVPLSELAYAEIAGSMLVIKKSGKFLNLVSVRSDKVPNVLLLLEEMQKLGVGARKQNALDPMFRAGVG